MPAITTVASVVIQAAAKELAWASANPASVSELGRVEGRKAEVGQQLDEQPRMLRVQRAERRQH